MGNCHNLAVPSARMWLVHFNWAVQMNPRQSKNASEKILGTVEPHPLLPGSAFGLSFGVWRGSDWLDFPQPPFACHTRKHKLTSFFGFGYLLEICPC